MVEAFQSAISYLYNKPDTLSHFNTKECSYTFLSNKQTVSLTARLAGRIEKSPYEKVLVAETGASPIAEICDVLLQRTTKDVEWQCIKVPREPVKNILHPLIHYLTEEERKEKLPQNSLERLTNDLQTVGVDETLIVTLPQMSREEILRFLTKQIPIDEYNHELPSLPELLRQLPTREQSQMQTIVSHVTQDCRFPRFLQNPFLYFDEYIDSGKTLQQTDIFMNFLAKTPDYKTLSYYVFIAYPQHFSVVFSTLYSHDTREECYRLGAYPFENRIDLIGHFYAISDDFFKRISVTELPVSSEQITEQDGKRLLTELNSVIKKEKLLDIVVNGLENSEVKSFVKNEHVLRFLFYLLEKEISGDSEVSQFLWQCFDMYGPCWSPLPDRFHLDYYKGFSELERNLPKDSLQNCLELYRSCRSAILVAITQEFDKRRAAWQRDTKALIKEEYGN